MLVGETRGVALWEGRCGLGGPRAARGTGGRAAVAEWLGRRCWSLLARRSDRVVQLAGDVPQPLKSEPLVQTRHLQSRAPHVYKR